MKKIVADQYVIAHSTRKNMIPTGFYDSTGKVVRKASWAARFDHLTDILDFVEAHGIKLDRENFVSHCVDLFGECGCPEKVA